ncbi:DUF4279 domain-containing protein [Maribellus sp. CM-23]|uniref:DUF4279 domain-containing protein n=1 Tax=Maribellus sp. CM-23 TaxID=2781026 RepID=UPI001F29FF8E|nr:DUF4279 domain-containing protein [Maribellus sp. CM-23]MCE4564662.1 DUF4279 domain-containing protein [Maribellus sp. CM-23]
MAETEIKIEFSIYHDSTLDHDEITKIMHFEPTLTYNNGDQVRENLVRKESAWIYSTEYIRSLYLDPILESIIQRIEPNIIPLSEYVRKYGLSSKFDIVLRIGNDQPPSYYLPKRFIHICSKLNADIDTDIYIL